MTAGRKLTAAEIEQIRQLADEDVSSLAVAVRFQITTNTVRAIWRLSEADLQRRIAEGRGPRTCSPAFRDQQRTHGFKGAGGAAPSGRRPSGIRAEPFTERWWLENQENFVRAMRAAHPERETRGGGVADSSNQALATRERGGEA